MSSTNHSFCCVVAVRYLGLELCVCVCVAHFIVRAAGIKGKLCSCAATSGLPYLCLLRGSATFYGKHILTTVLDASPILMGPVDASYCRADPRFQLHLYLIVL